MESLLLVLYTYQLSRLVPFLINFYFVIKCIKLFGFLPVLSTQKTFEYQVILLTITHLL